MYACIFLCAHAHTHTQSKAIRTPSKNLCFTEYLPSEKEQIAQSPNSTILEWQRPAAFSWSRVGSEQLDS